MPYDEDQARVIELERTTRELVQSVRQLNSMLLDVQELRRAQARTRRAAGIGVAAGLALLLLSAVCVSLFLLHRINDLIDTRRDSVRVACIARNDERVDLRERLTTLSRTAKENKDVYAELVKAFPPSAVDCEKI